MNKSNTATIATSAAGVLVASWCVYQYMTYDCRWWWRKREQVLQPNVSGVCQPGWERVREEFLSNFAQRGELGATVCIYYQGELVVHLWGGYRDGAAKAPWKEDTLAPIFSTSKGISAFAIQMLASRGKLDLDDKVVQYWPEFGVHGKQNVTIRQIMDHSVGLAGIHPPVTFEMLQQDPGVVRNHIAAAQMEWPNAGDYKGYMALMLGFYESALVQMTDGRTLGQYLRDEAFTKLGIEDELFIGLPDSIPDDRLARLDGMSGLEPLWPTGTFPDGFMSKILLSPNSYGGRAFRNPQLSSMPGVMDYDRRDIKRVEIPAANGTATARGVARMYAAAERAINDSTNNPLGLSQEVMARFLEPAKPGRNNGWIDEILGIEACMGGGVLLPAPDEYSGTGRFVSCPGKGFGTPGAGGSFGFCDPQAEIAFCYIPNRCGQFIMDDPREYALRAKMYECVHHIRLSQNRTGLDLPKCNTPHYLTQLYLRKYPKLAPLP